MAKQPEVKAEPAKEAPKNLAKADDRVEALEAALKALTSRVRKLEGSNGEVREVLAARLNSRGIAV